MPRIATTAKFPTSLVTLADIGLFTNREDADLVQDETAATTTLHLDDATPIAVGMRLASLSEDGFEVVRVTAVDLALATVTVVRGQDGTVAVAHKQGQTWKAVPTASALNQVRDEVIAIETFLGIDGDCIHWDRGLELEPSSDTCAILTLNLKSTRTNKKFVSFKVDDVETGLIQYDQPNDAIEFQGIRVDIGTGSDVLLEDDRQLIFGTALNANMRYKSANGRVEYASDIDLRFQTATGSTELFSITGTALVANKTLQPRTTGTIDIGTRSLLWRDIYVGAASLHVIATAGDANDLYRLGTAGLSGGAGGASALDAFLGRQAASVWEATGNLAGSIRYGLSLAATPFLDLRLAAADAQPAAELLKDRLTFGAGGANALDVAVARQAASVLEVTGSLAGSFRFGMSGAGAPFTALRLAAADAQPFYTVTTSGIALGAGGASATDILLARRASSDLLLTGALAGDVRLGMTGAATPRVSLRLATADALHAAAILTDRVEFGAGGASAVDYSLVRTGANTGTLSGTLRPSSTAVYDLGSAALVWANVYNRVYTIDNQGAGADVVLQANNAAQRANLAGHLSPSADNTWDLGEAAVRWANGYFAAMTTGTILPSADNTYDLGSASFRWRDIYVTGSSLRVITTVGDANPTARLGSALLAFGAGGATATDIQYARQAASIVELTGSLAGSVRYGMSGAATPFLALRAAAADAQPLATILTDRIAFGAGGASAVDTGLVRYSANLLSGISENTLNLGSNSQRLGSVVTGTSGLFIYNAAGDANAIVRVTASQGLSMGTGGASARDVFLIRQASSVWEVTGALAGSVRAGMTGAATPIVSGRLDAADANSFWHLGSDVGLSFGVGGATARDSHLARQAASILELTGSLAGSVRYGMSGAATPFLALRAAAADAQPLITLLTDRLSIGAGGASAVDTELVRTGANAATLSATLSPATDNARDLGTATLRWRSLYLTPTSLHVLAASADANDVTTIGNALIKFGAGGASATDNQLARQAASIVEQTGNLAGSVRFGMSGAATPFLALRAAAADAQPLATVLTDRIAFGAGGASAVDVTIQRTVASLMDITASSGIRGNATFISNVGAAGTEAFRALVSGDAAGRRWSVNADGTTKWGDGAATQDITLQRQAASVLEHTGNLAGSVRWGMSGAATPFLALRGAAADANALVSLTSTGINFGPGGATAVDSSLLRQAASVLEHTGSLAGSIRHGMSGAAVPFVSGRLAAADANSAWHLGADVGLSFGAGGATARDIFIERVIPTANKLIHLGAASAGTTGVWIDTTTPGVILKDTQGSPHYWRITVDNTGALTTTDIGTALP